MYVQLAWRNIWRNPRRTAVILIAVIIGVWSGHIQIHQKGYRDDPAIENSITDLKTVEKALNEVLPPEALWCSRVRVNAIASNARHSSGVTLVGIDPSDEAKVSFIGTALTRGRYLRPDDRNAIIVGKALLDKLETKIDRKLVLMSQDTNQEIASRAFRIVGAFQAEMEAIEKQFVFITRVASQEMLKLYDGISEVSILIPNNSEYMKVSDDIKSSLSSENFEVHNWRELLPFQTAYLRILDGFIWIWFLVVFVAMGFGIVNTTLMAVFERMREFGLMKALGMKPWWILREVLVESFLLLITGMMVGNVLGFICIYAFSGNGIDLSAMAAGAEYAGMSRIIYPTIAARDLWVANLTVLLLGLLVSVYPAIKAARFTPVEALAHT
jgi:ABC-type lipoprotein release transport system permease subunit